MTALLANMDPELIALVAFWAVVVVALVLSSPGSLQRSDR